MEMVKNVAAIVGCITASLGLLTTICKPIRKRMVDFIRKTSHQDETTRQYEEIRALIEDSNKRTQDFMESVNEKLDISMDFTEKRCRSDLKNIFYKYRDMRVLPLYEKKTLMDLEELYIDRLHKNHWGKALIEEMKTWDVDSSSACETDFE